MPGQLERIAAFVAVAQAGSFTGAARAIGVSPSAVTRAVAELEAELGAQLLTRTTRAVALTQPGRLYLDDVGAALAALEAAAERVRHEQNVVDGPLRVAVPLSFGIRIFPQVVSAFRIAHPQVTLVLDLSDRFIDILAGRHDMALRISGPPSDKSTIWRKICAVPRAFVAAPAYLERRGIPEAPEALADHEILAYGQDPEGEVYTLSDGHRRVTVAPRPAAVADNGDLLASLALSGDGIALLPRFLVSQELADGRLREVLARWRPPEIWLTAYYPPYERLPAKVRVFTEFIEARVAEAPDLLR